MTPIARGLLKLAWPLALSNVLVVCDSFCVRYWLGHAFGREGLAVHTTTAPIIGVVQLLFVAVATGAGVAIARSVGARDGQGQTLAANAMALATLLAAIVAVAALAFAGPVAAWVAKRDLAPDHVRELLQSYLVVAIPLVTMSLILTTAAASAGWGRLSLIWGVTHVPPVFGLLPLGLGPLGLGYHAPAFAVGLAALLNTVVLLAIVRRHAARLHLGTSIDRRRLFDRTLWRENLDVGMPQQLARAATWFVMLVIVLHVAEDGVTVLAGYGVAMIYLDLAGSLTGGYARACAILMAQALGAKAPGKARAILATALGHAVMFPAATIALLYVGAPLAVRVFANHDSVVPEGIRALRLMAFVLIPASVWQVLLAAFGAAKATKRAFLLTLVAQAIALGVVLVWPWDRVVGALATLGTMYGLTVVFYVLLSRRVLWRGALAVTAGSP